MMANEPTVFDITSLLKKNSNAKRCIQPAHCMSFLDENDTGGKQAKVVFDNPELIETLCNGARVKVNWSAGDVEISQLPRGGTCFKIRQWQYIDKGSIEPNPWETFNVNPPQQVQQQQPGRVLPNSSAVGSSYGPDRSRPKSLDTLGAHPFAQPPSGTASHAPQVPHLDIAKLNPYVSNYVIKGRCVSVDREPRTWSNAKGEGKLAKVVFADGTGEIAGIMFNSTCDKFHPILREGMIYSVSKARIKQANERFKSSAHSCELTFDDNTIITPVDEDDSVPKGPLMNFVKINTLESCTKGDSVDVCGVLVGGGELQSILIKKTGQNKAKRDVTIVDDSESAINVCLWGDSAINLFSEEKIQDARDMYCSGANPITVVIKSAAVDEFNGKNLAVSFNSKLYVDPTDIPEAAAVRDWFNSSYRNRQSNVRSLSNTVSNTTLRMTISELHSLESDPLHQEALDGKGVWCLVKAFIRGVSIDGRFFWEACVTCGRKVQDASADTYTMTDTEKYCGNCNKNVDSTKKWVLKTDISDTTGELKVTVFGDKASIIMGTDCNEAYKLSSDDTLEDKFGRNFEDLRYYPGCRQYNLKICGKYKIWNDVKSLDFSLHEITDINMGKELISETVRLAKVLSEGSS